MKNEEKGSKVYDFIRAMTNSKVLGKTDHDLLLFFITTIRQNKVNAQNQ